MTTLTLTKECVTHTPNKSAISTVGFYSDEQYTFCEVCESNIDRFFIESDGDRLGQWSKWRVTK